jgi:hypothetical protein
MNAGTCWGKNTIGPQRPVCWKAPGSDFKCVRTHWRYQYYVLYLAWWCFKETETCRRIFNIDYQYILLCYWLNKSLYYCKTQRDGLLSKFVQNLIPYWCTEATQLFCFEQGHVGRNVVTLSYLVAASHPRKTQSIPQINKGILITFTNISTFIQLSICSYYCKVSLT